MKVAVNTLGTNLGEGGGDEQYLLRVLPQLHDAQKGTDIVILTADEGYTGFNGFEKVKVSSPEAAAKAAHKNKADVLLSPLRTAPSRCSVPIVLFVMELYDLRYATKPRGFLRSSPLKDARDIAAEASAVVVPSEFMKREVLELLGVPLDKVVVAPLGVDGAFAEQQHCIVEKPYFLAVGSMSERKNLPALLEAFSRVSQEIPHNLVVVGPPAEDEPENWGPRVFRIDRVGTTQLAGLYQHADLFVCPSVYEGSGVLVLEALKAGARVATGRVGGITEVAGDAPIFFNPESVDSLVGALRRAVSEGPAEIERRLQARKPMMNEFTWEKTAWKTLSALRRATSGQAQD